MKIISVENLSKRYYLTHDKGVYGDSFRDVLTSKFSSMFKSGLSDGRKEEFWALNDVTFDVTAGDRLGIIGRNGAGKSTLLKILSRITPPTKGKITMRGRIASLLEVGTGFHPELTGRENIFLNGAILGMTKSEIQKKFDEIVAFSEVEKFLDTPVKRYSSGMYVRLAFAVAAHLEPEILIVDEVLAVGDASFQKKCLGKMQDVSKGDGRTVIFVSHNMNAIESLCNKAILLNKGEIEANSDDVRGVIKQYYSNSDLGMKPNKWVNDNDKLLENPWIIPMEISLTDKAGKLLKMPITNDVESYLEVKVNVVDNVSNLCLGYSVFGEGSENLYFSSIIDTPEKDWAHLDKGVNVLRTKIPARFLNEGDYKVELNTFIHMKRWILEPGRSNALVYLTIKGGLSDSDQWINKRAGLLAPVFKWDRIS